MATAVALEGHHFLLLQRVTGADDRQHILQRAREHALEHERVVKQIDALRRPFERLTRVFRDLAGSTDPAESQRAAVASVQAELDTIRQVLEDLLKAPRGTFARQQ